MRVRSRMPLHIGEYLRDTDHLTVAEHGAYLLLAMRVYRFGALPPADLLPRYARLSSEEWSASGERILAMFRRHGAGYSYYERMIGEDRKRSIPRALRRLVFGRDGQKCVYCGLASGPFQIDHKFPWSRGGRHELDNLCVACVECNAVKGALSEEEFREVRS
jgi:hypothetical protein